MNIDKAPVTGRDVGNLVFGSPGTLRAERGAAELRAGRPVVLRQEGSRVAVLALDAASPSIYEAFLAATDGDACLYLTPPRLSLIHI